MFKPDLKIGALSTFLQQLDKLGTGGKRLRYFRGHSKQSFQLKPSIFRNSGFINNEATMLKELILRCPNDFSGGLTTFQCLVKMQHYGLPTRLLDITSNPLVALYFACETNDQGDEDGEVIVFDYDVEDVKYFDSDTVSVVSNLSRRAEGFEIPEVEGDETDDKVIEAFNSQGKMPLLLHDIRNDKPHFLPKIIRSDLERVVCVKPMLDNPRIIRQEGAFLLFGCERVKTNPAKLKENAIAARFTIKREEKRNLLNQLNTLGISRATLFPEIEHVATHLKQAYLIPTIDLSKLTEKQRRLIGILREGSPQSVPELAGYINMKAGSVAGSISTLQRMGAVELVGSGRERRWKLVENLKIVEGDKMKPSDEDSGEDNA